jgi:hypothetical protein
LCVDISVRSAEDKETTAARDMLRRQRQRRIKPRSPGADKGYHHRDFAGGTREKVRIRLIAMLNTSSTMTMCAVLLGFTSSC